MSRPRIIIVDEDLSYILPLQLKFAEDMFGKIELEIITDRVYFELFMSIPQKADVLIISEEMYKPEVQKHNIKNIFLLTESYGEVEDVADNVTIVYKYTSMKEIFTVILGKTSGLSEDEADKKMETQMVLVTSAAGGTGKTTIAMGVAACLAQKYKKVLYLNSDYMQSFQWLLINQKSITDNEVYMRMGQAEKNIYQHVKHLIRTEVFDYLPPFKSALLSLNLKHSVISELALQAKKSKEYNYIIVDADSCFDLDKVMMLGEADKVLVITTQNDMSVHVTNQFVSNIDMTDKDRFLFVCNMYEETKDNAIVSLVDNLNFRVTDYIEMFHDYWKMKDEKFASSPGIQSLSFSIL